MFIGHFGLGLAAKRIAPEAPLWLLFVAAQLADVLWPILLALGLDMRAVRARRAWMRARLWTLAAFLMVVYLARLVGPPPPSLRAVYSSTIGLFGTVLVWSWWAEKA